MNAPPSAGSDVTRLSVERMSDAAVARSLARQFGGAHGMSLERSTEIAIIAGELATNLVRHARGGFLELEWRDGTVLLRSLDRGTSGPVPVGLQTITDTDPCPVDSKGAAREGIGCGLAAVRRLSDELRVQRRSDGWLEITASRRQ